MIRFGTTKDLPAIADVMPAPFAESGMPGKFNREAFIRVWARMLDYSPAFILVDERDGKVAGCLFAYDVEEPFTGEKMIAVHTWMITKEYRGTGGGSALCEAFLAEAVKRGAKIIAAGCVLNQSACKVRRFYTQRGFRVGEFWLVREEK